MVRWLLAQRHASRFHFGTAHLHRHQRHMCLKNLSKLGHQLRAGGVFVLGSVRIVYHWRNQYAHLAMKDNESGHMWYFSVAVAGYVRNSDKLTNLVILMGQWWVCFFVLAADRVRTRPSRTVTTKDAAMLLKQSLPPNTKYWSANTTLNTSKYSLIIDYYTP